ncbi:MAG: pectate lyase [Blastocatellia bacterium]|nr:pectate lyase [Blastocatellia bacterium]
MNRSSHRRILSLALLPLLLLAVGARPAAMQTAQFTPWKRCLAQPPAWYGGAEAARIADNLLAYQRTSGGWPKNTEMAAPLDEAGLAAIRAQKGTVDSTIDNGATYTQLAFLARVFTRTKQDRFRESFLRGLDYLFAAQYPNGGWPQFYPLQRGYYTHITFNDDAMIGVMSLLREIAREKPEYAFVDAARRARSAAAVEKGIELILKSQVRVDGRRTAWCAQHDETTLAPAPARTYEKISLSGSESVGIVRFLMGIERPEPRVVEAVEAAADWLRASALRGIRIVDKPDPALPRGFDRVVVQDERAAPVWARFYEIGANRPIFSGRDGVIRASLAEIEHERRVGYSWYTTAPAALLDKELPAWRARVGAAAPQTNYLFAYFRNNGEDGLHLAHSVDGLTWTPLNGDRSWLTPTVGSQKLMRDPCIIQGPDGMFHMVWTTGWRGTDIGIAHSPDLLQWSEQQAIPVMGHEPTAVNCWAPEIMYDAATGQYLIFWATTIPGRFPATEASGNNGLNHRMYFVTTRDFKTYSRAALFYDGGFNVIDATIIRDDRREGGRYVMILKDETAQPVRKNLRIAESGKAAGPYGAASAPFTRDWVEGPTAIRIGDEWIVYYDMYREKRYGAVRSRDLKQWEEITAQIHFPDGARHGTVLRVSAETLARLRAAAK